MINCLTWLSADALLCSKCEKQKENWSHYTHKLTSDRTEAIIHTNWHQTELKPLYTQTDIRQNWSHYTHKLTSDRVCIKALICDCTHALPGWGEQEKQWLFQTGGGASMDRWWCKYGQVVVQVWTGGGASMDRWWCKYGQVVVQVWTGGGASMDRWWCKYGQVVVQVWTGGGASMDRNRVTWPYADTVYFSRFVTRNYPLVWELNKVGTTSIPGFTLNVEEIHMAFFMKSCDISGEEWLTWPCLEVKLSTRLMSAALQLSCPFSE